MDSILSFLLGFSIGAAVMLTIVILATRQLKDTGKK